MPPPPAITEEPEDEEWIVTYADAITLLMAFFVMLVSFSKIDMEIYDQVMSGIQAEIGKVSDNALTTSQELTKAIESAAFELQMEQNVEVQKTDRGVSIEMDSNSFFKPGTAEIMPAAGPLLAAWSKTLGDEKFKFFAIEVEGHTDDDPINTPRYPSNWELSADRAAAVVRTMNGEGLHKFKMSAIGLGDSHPKLPNRNMFGEAIPINQAKNRRVAINLVKMNPSERKEFAQVLSEERILEEERRRREEDEAARKAQQEKVDAANQENGTAPSTAPADETPPAEAPPTAEAPPNEVPAQ